MKTRNDAALNLDRMSEERAEQIIEWMDTKPSEGSLGGWQLAQQQLALDGIKAGKTALYDFHARWRQRSLYAAASQRAEEQKNLMLDFDPNDVERAEKFGDHCFLQLAIEAQDPKTFLALRNTRITEATSKHMGRIAEAKLQQGEAKLKQKDEELSLATRRVVLLEENQRSAKAKLEAVLTGSKGGITPETLRIIEEAANLL